MKNYFKNIQKSKKDYAYNYNNFINEFAKTYPNICINIDIITYEIIKEFQILLSSISRHKSKRYNMGHNLYWRYPFMDFYYPHSPSGIDIFRKVIEVKENKIIIKKNSYNDETAVFSFEEIKDIDKTKLKNLFDFLDEYLKIKNCFGDDFSQEYTDENISIKCMPQGTITYSKHIGDMSNLFIKNIEDFGTLSRYGSYDIQDAIKSSKKILEKINEDSFTLLFDKSDIFFKAVDEIESKRSTIIKNLEFLLGKIKEENVSFKLIKGL